MFSAFHYFKGFLSTLFNSRVSLFALVSSDSKIEKKTSISRGVKLYQSSVGSYTYIAAHTYVENAIIGKFCSISDHCRIGMSSHSLYNLSTSPIFTERNNALGESWTPYDCFQNKDEDEKLYVGNDVWIGSHVLIKGGIRIGDGACIGAGAVVTKNIPPYAIVGGVPAQIIRYRFSSSIIEKLIEIRWWNMSDAELRNKISLFQKSNLSLVDLAALK